MVRSAGESNFQMPMLVSCEKGREEPQTKLGEKKRERRGRSEGNYHTQRLSMLRQEPHAPHLRLACSARDDQQFRKALPVDIMDGTNHTPTAGYKHMITYE
ncbi:hypothetical protein PMIN06_011879 [Paraphaeosphaeria minitans]